MRFPAQRSRFAVRLSRTGWRRKSLGASAVNATQKDEVIVTAQVLNAPNADDVRTVSAPSRAAFALPPVDVPFGKRALDVTLSGVGLVVSSPIWARAGGRDQARRRGPVFFGQERVGEGGPRSSRC